LYKLEQFNLDLWWQSKTSWYWNCR